MAYSKKLFTVTGGYGTNTSNWKTTRPTAFVPFHTDNATYMTGPVYTKDRFGGDSTWETNTNSSDLTRFNADGMWYNGDWNSSRAYRHRTDNNRDRHSVVLCGWPYGQRWEDIENATSAPITQFAGITFKWNTADSHWSDSAIRINSKSAVGLVCYDWNNGKTYVQRTESMYYSGRSPITDGSNGAVSNNACSFLLSSSDLTWIRQNKIYLVGFYIQFFQKNEGGSSRYRYFNMWDLQVVYNTQGVGQSGYNSYRMAMPGKQANGIGYHGTPAEQGTRRAINIYHA